MAFSPLHFDSPNSIYINLDKEYYLIYIDIFRITAKSFATPVPRYIRIEDETIAIYNCICITFASHIKWTVFERFGYFKKKTVHDTIYKNEFY